MSLITCQDAAFGYDGQPAVRNLNFHVDKGDYLCIVGENGAGKSTLIKGLLGLIAPLSGRIITGDGFRQSEIGYLPQQTQAQKDFPASVYEVVISGRLGARGIRPFYTKADRAAAEQYIERLSIQNIRNHCYRELSGGQQQRVLLARALCATKSLLLLDEPVSGLDPLATQDLYKLIADINRELGITVLMVSHDVNSAVRQAGAILHLNHEQLFFGPTADYLRSEAGNAFLGGEKM